MPMPVVLLFLTLPSQATEDTGDFDLLSDSTNTVELDRANIGPVIFNCCLG